MKIPRRNPAILLTLLLASCAPTERAKDPIPASLDFIPQAAQASPEEAQRLASLVSSVKVASVGKFHLREQNEEAEGRREREERWARLSVPLRERLNSIPRLCDLTHPRETIIEEAKPEVGSRSSSTTFAAIRGEKCPAREEDSSATQGTILAINQEAGTYAMKINRSQSTKTEMLDPDWIRETGLRSQKMEMQMSGTMNWAGSNQTNTAHMTLTLTGEFILSQGETIKLTGSAEYLLRGTTDRARNELVMHLALSEGNATLPISVLIVTEPGNEPSVRAVVNGNEKPLEELEGLLGSVKP